MTRPDNKARNERIIELAKTMGPAQILRVMQAEGFENVNRNKVIGIVHRYCPQDEDSKKRRQREGVRLHQIERQRRGGTQGRLGLAEPTAEQRAKAHKPKVAPPRPIGDPDKRPAPLPLRTIEILETPLQESTPVPYAKRTGCCWPFGERESMIACNLPKCYVRKPGGIAERVEYCAGHWDARRASKYTQVVA